MNAIDYCRESSEKGDSSSRAVWNQEIDANGIFGQSKTIDANSQFRQLT